MTAAFDATRGTDQRFTDALAGSDGTADPSVMMPVLDVYPDALSAPMPVEASPVVLPVVVAMGRAGVRAEPVVGPGGAVSAGRLSAKRGGQPVVRPGAARQPLTRPQALPGPGKSAPPRPPVRAYRPIAAAPASPRQQPRSFNWQGRPMSPSDIAAMVRAGLQGQPGQVDRISLQATHPQSMGSAAPPVVAPAAPIASQYSGRGQARNDARERSQERRRTTVPVKRRSSSLFAVLVLFLVILFASGLGEKLIDLVNELLNR